MAGPLATEDGSTITSHTCDGGRRELRSTGGTSSIEGLQKVVLARTRTAREAILMMGSLAEMGIDIRTSFS